MYADLIENLPTDKNTISQTEADIVNTLFKKKAMIDIVLSSSKEVLLAGILFVVISVPQIDEFVKKFIPIANNSQYILLFLKSLIFMILFFVIKNLYLARKK